jgi:peroxiredoxin
MRALLLVLFLMTNGAAHAQAGWTAFSASGGQAPKPLLLDDLDGKAVDLASLKGQVVLINFWATWCDGCRTEIPAFNRLQQKFGARKLQIVGVNVAEGKPRIADFMQRIPIQFTVLRDPDMVVLKAWQVHIMPTTFLLDRNGMLRYQLVGEADWDDPKIQAPVLELLK